MRSRDGQNQQRSAHQERFQADSNECLSVSAAAEALLGIPAQREHAFPSRDEGSYRGCSAATVQLARNINHL
jgi:hypothetical protein